MPRMGETRAGEGKRHDGESRGISRQALFGGGQALRGGMEEDVGVRVLAMETCTKVRGEEVSALKTGWLKNEERRISERQKSTGTRRVGHVGEVFLEPRKPTATIPMDPEKESGPKASTQTSKRQKREAENEFCVGGMRNPLGSVKRLWKVKNVGKQIRLAWEQFLKERPASLRLGEAYGSAEAQYDETLAMEWQIKLAAILGVTARDGLTLTDKLMFKSPLIVDLWRGWFKATGDPDYHVAEWAENGFPWA